MANYTGARSLLCVWPWDTLGCCGPQLWPQEEEESLLWDSSGSLHVGDLAPGILREQKADQDRLDSAPSVSGFCLASQLCFCLSSLQSLPLSAAAQQETGKLLPSSRLV